MKLEYIHIIERLLESLDALELNLEAGEWSSGRPKEIDYCP